MNTHGGQTLTAASASPSLAQRSPALVFTPFAHYQSQEPSSKIPQSSTLRDHLAGMLLQHIQQATPVPESKRWGNANLGFSDE